MCVCMCVYGTHIDKVNIGIFCDSTGSSILKGFLIRKLFSIYIYVHSKTSTIYIYIFIYINIYIYIYILLSYILQMVTSILDKSINGNKTYSICYKRRGLCNCCLSILLTPLQFINSNYR